MPEGTITLRDVENNGGVVSDELLEPFVVGESEDERNLSRENLRSAVGGYVRYLDGVDVDVRSNKRDTPIVSLPDDEPSEDEEYTQPEEPVEPGRE